ncbi:MAG: DUF2798 domain-containing protein [Pseudomonadota bacterium]
MKNPEYFITPIVMATVMSFVMSGLITTINLGLDQSFLANWMGAWKISLPIAITGVLLTRPLVERISRLITRNVFNRRSNGIG